MRDRPDRVHEGAEHVGPTAFGGQRVSVALSAIAVPPELIMGDGDARAVIDGIEANLYSAGPPRVRLRRTVGADLPGEHEAIRRLPDEHPAPVAAKVVRAPLDAVPPLPRLHLH